MTKKANGRLIEQGTVGPSSRHADIIHRAPHRPMTIYELLDVQPLLPAYLDTRTHAYFIQIYNSLRYVEEGLARGNRFGRGCTRPRLAKSMDRRIGRSCIALATSWLLKAWLSCSPRWIRSEKSTRWSVKDQPKPCMVCMLLHMLLHYECKCSQGVKMVLCASLLHPPSRATFVGIAMPRFLVCSRSRVRSLFSIPRMILLRSLKSQKTTARNTIDTEIISESIINSKVHLANDRCGYVPLDILRQIQI